jgi:phosphoribosyl 1,2-cyclic phosphodiesterase
MKLRIWGCRGSLPVPGQTTLKYGGNTTCLELRLDDGTVIVIDAGSGIRNLGKKLIGEKGLRDIYLLLTHSHWDHLMGFPFFAPAYSEQYSIHVRGGPIAKETLKQSLEHQMEPPYFPARMNEMKADFDITHGIPIIKRIGSAEITSIPLNHPNGGFGYALREYDKSIVFLTDNELNYQHRGGKTYSEYVSFCRGADLLIHDAQYTKNQYQIVKTWGHSTYYDAVHLALDARVKHLMFFHHDPDRTDVELDQIITQYNDVLNKMKSKIQLSAAIEGEEISGLCP